MVVFCSFKDKSTTVIHACNIKLRNAKKKSQKMNTCRISLNRIMDILVSPFKNIIKKKKKKKKKKKNDLRCDLPCKCKVPIQI